MGVESRVRRAAKTFFDEGIIEIDAKGMKKEDEEGGSSFVEARVVMGKEGRERVMGEQQLKVRRDVYHFLPGRISLSLSGVVEYYCPLLLHGTAASI